MKSQEAIDLLKNLISIPSLSKEEHKTADIIQNFFEDRKFDVARKGNNLWVRNRTFSTEKPTILLNSHHDTVKPNAGYSKDPFFPELNDDKLYGLGSNDAGGALVSLIATFLHFANAEMTHNLILAATAEEEISGQNGIASILEELGDIDFAIVGEPTKMQMAIAEKGLMVLDCEAQGIAGHAARDEGDNAIYKAMKAISWFESYQFDEQSPSLGPIKMTVTQVEAGTQHNVVPDRCRFVVDVRSTDAYQNIEILELIKKSVDVKVAARSTRLNPSGISLNHPVVQSGFNLGLTTYGSPTLSDQALLTCPSLKIGPGDSARSHTADEFIHLSEIKEGIETYIQLLEPLLKPEAI
jgi:acetylornithine deacetylase